MNVQELLEQKQIKFRINGQDLLIRCLDPDHEDRHPSMRIDRVRGIFNCLSCGFKGNIFKHFGVQQSVVDINLARLKQKISSLLVNSENLVIPYDAIPFEEDFRGISKDIYKYFEAFTCSSIEELQDRIIFPIKSVTGKTKAFIGRAHFSEAPPKYKIYPPNVSKSIWPTHPFIVNNTLIVVEGIFDVLNLADKNIPNVVCVFGVNNVKLENFLYFKILGVTKIYILFDGDEAGQQGAEKAVKILEKDFITESITLAKDTDPGSMSEEDTEILRKYINEDSIS